MSQRSKTKNESGIALMVVLFSLAFMSIVAYEIIYASRVDLRISANARDRLQAWDLAQSSARISVLRLHLYRVAKNVAAKNEMLKSQTALIDKVWNFALPSLPFSSQVYGEDHRLPGEISGRILSEGSLIPINLLDGNESRNSSAEISEQVEKELTKLIEGFLEDDNFYEKHKDLRPEDLIQPLVDWIDEDRDAQSGGDEIAFYERLNPPYEPRNDRIPVLSELLMVQGWNDELFQKISPELSVTKTKMTLNPNYLSLSRIKSFHPSLTQEDLQFIEERRREKPFRDLNELAVFINSSSDIRGVTGSFEFPFEFKSSTDESLFRIEATGQVGLARRVLRLMVRLDEVEDEETKKKQPSPDINPETGEETPAPVDPAKSESPFKLKSPKVVSIEVLV